jgi:hypothetical protein
MRIVSEQKQSINKVYLSLQATATFFDVPDDSGIKNFFNRVFRGKKYLDASKSLEILSGIANEIRAANHLQLEDVIIISPKVQHFGQMMGFRHYEEMKDIGFK